MPPWIAPNSNGRCATGTLLPYPPSVPCRDVRGPCQSRTDPGLGGEPFYYQVNIPLKDAAILANCPDREVRREWIQRILDHDGAPGEAGGIEAWLRLAEAVGLEREQVLSEERVLPGVRFAVDAYVNFARRASWQEAASSSLTELFAPQIHQSRLDSWPRHYPWIEAAGYSISAVAWPRPGATSSTACGSPWSTIGPARHRNACWISCNSSWTCCGACSTR